MAKYVVRFGCMRTLGVFHPRGSDMFARGTRVVARTNRGLEVGEILCEATDEALQHLRSPPHGQILRVMTSDDQNELTHIHSQEIKEFEACRQRVHDLHLQMELVDIEHLFGGERIVIYYLAEDRVDFRELVKQLAAEFQTRIEMRQIGVRDEAKLLVDYGDCGKPVCCNTHLSEMPPVSMKMAKLQKATLDPTKISGRCGRLKCCLRYEFDTYEELQKQLPPVGSEIITNAGRARVLQQEILAQQLLVETEDHRRVLVDASEILTVLGKKPRSDRPRAENSPAETSRAGKSEHQKPPHAPRRREKSGPKSSQAPDAAAPDAAAPDAAAPDAMPPDASSADAPPEN